MSKREIICWTTIRVPDSQIKIFKKMKTLPNESCSLVIQRILNQIKSCSKCKTILEGD